MVFPKRYLEVKEATHRSVAISIEAWKGSEHAEMGWCQRCIGLLFIRHGSDSHKEREAHDLQD